MKKKILVYADIPNWAYHNIARFIKRTLSDEFEIHIDFIIYYPTKWSAFASIPVIKRVYGFLRQLYLDFKLRSKYRDDCWRDLYAEGRYDVVIFLGYHFPFKRKLPCNASKVVKCIANDNFPPTGFLPADANIGVKDFVEKYLSDADAIVCSEYAKEYFYSNMDNITCLYFSYDESLFKRITCKRLNKSEDFIVGWTGNPNHYWKGYYEVIVPAVEKAAAIKPGIKLKSRFEGPLETLPRFYDDVDVIAIASDGDAGPSLFTEASLCDVPAISTRIGAPAKVINDGVNGLFIERDVEKLAEAIVTLYEDRDLLFSLSQRIRSDYISIYGENACKEAWRRLLRSLCA